MSAPSIPWLELTLILPCTNKCNYCPQDVLFRNYKGEKILTFDNYKKILENVPTDVTIDFAGFSEPFLNTECADMILYTYALGYNIYVNTTLVGATDNDLNRIKHIPFQDFRIHDIGRPFDNKDFFTAVDRITYPSSRAGNLYNVTANKSVNCCSRDKHRRINVMLPNGDVALCCSDYGLKYNLGNLYHTNYYDLKRNSADYLLCQKCVWGCWG